jgi:microcystin-dependent protein
MKARPIPMQSAVLRASVTADSATTEGEACTILVDGADTACTASGLTGYTPTPGDRLLVQRVGGVIEVIQFLNRGVVPSAGGVSVYYQDSEPTGASLHSGDIWYDTSDGNHPYVYDGTAWQDVQDQGIVTAQDAAATAQSTANAKTATYTQGTQPTASAVGDVWIDPSHGNAQSVWDGTTWVAAPFGAGALSDDMLAGKIVPIDEAVTLAWGVPDPSDDLSGVSSTTGPEPWLNVAWPSDVSQAVGLTPDGSNFATVEVTSTTNKWRLVTINRSTGARTVIGTITVGKGGGTGIVVEQCGGLVKIGSSYYVFGSRSIIGGANDGQWNVYTVNSSGSITATHTIKTFAFPVPDYAWLNNPQIATNGTIYYICWWDDSDNKFHVQGYTTAGATSGSQVNSGTATSGELSSFAYGSFDFGANRYLIGLGDFGPGSVVSLNTSGAIQSSEGWTLDLGQQIGAGGMCWDSTSSRIVVLGGNGLARYTANTSDLSVSAAYSWSDENATGGTHETAMSPAIALTVPKRGVVTLSRLPIAPGASGTGTDAPSSFNLYFASTAGAPSTYHLQHTITYPTASVVGTQDLTNARTALATSTFVTGASGSIVSESGGFEVFGDGTGDWPHLRKSVMPIGMITPYGGASAPTGWLACNGTAVSRTTYADLFAVIGTTFGAGDGSTTFNLPNLADKVPLGVGTFALGHADGNGQMPAHTHSIDHDHASFTKSVQSANTTTAGGTTIRVTDIGNVTGGGGTSNDLTFNVPAFNGSSGSAGSGSLNLPPYLAVVYIIYAGT